MIRLFCHCVVVKLFLYTLLKHEITFLKFGLLLFYFYALVKRAHSITILFIFFWATCREIKLDTCADSTDDKLLVIFVFCLISFCNRAAILHD